MHLKLLLISSRDDYVFYESHVQTLGVVEANKPFLISNKFSTVKSDSIHIYMCQCNFSSVVYFLKADMFNEVIYQLILKLDDSRKMFS